MGRDTSALGAALGVTMESTSIILNFQERIITGEMIDQLDDERREEFIKRMRKHLRKLEEFAKRFEDKEFIEYVRRERAYFERDIKEQIYYENMDDELRDGMKGYSERALEKQRTENENYNRKMILDGKIQSLETKKGIRRAGLTPHW